jgi:hypothetical protein
MSEYLWKYIMVACFFSTVSVFCGLLSSNKGRIKTIESNPAKEASCANINWTLKAIKCGQVNVKENCVVISIAI